MESLIKETNGQIRGGEIGKKFALTWSSLWPTSQRWLRSIIQLHNGVRTRQVSSVHRTAQWINSEGLVLFADYLNIDTSLDETEIKDETDKKQTDSQPASRFLVLESSSVDHHRRHHSYSPRAVYLLSHSFSIHSHWFDIHHPSAAVAKYFLLVCVNINM